MLDVVWLVVYVLSSVCIVYVIPHRIQVLWTKYVTKKRQAKETEHGSTGQAIIICWPRHGR